ncbi:MAG: hypothetical protein OXR07_07595 [Nitrospira sp.]|nr:hypothetical protein [Nitrospira sp.]MDD9859418.1 hypothetical protein [Nitrospira sp.]
MSQAMRKDHLSGEYLETLEEVKRQYQQYLEVSRIYELPVFQKKEEPQQLLPSLEHPLTTNTFCVK